MSQWGKTRNFILPTGTVLTVVAHVDTPTWSGPHGGLVDDLIVIQTTGPHGEYLRMLRAKYVGKEYKLWCDDSSP